MKIFTLLHKSTDKGTINLGQWSRMGTVNVRTTSDSILSRICLASLILLMLGGFTTRAWALGNSVPTYNGSTWYSLYDASMYDNDNNTTQTRNLNFDVVPPTSGTIYLDWRKNDYWPGADIYVNDTKIAYVNAMSNSHKSFETVNTSLGENATTVKIGIHGSSKHSAEVESLKVAMKPHIRLDNSDAVGVTSKSGTLANTVYGNTSAAYHIDLRSFLMTNSGSSRVLKYQSSNGDFHFGSGDTVKTYTLKNNACAFDGGTANCASSNTALGDPDDYEADVYFTPRTNKNGSSSTTITIYDGATARATITLTAKVIPTYYFKATSVATDGTSTLDIPVKASFTSGVYSGSTLTVSQTAATADVASLTKRAYFYAPASSGDYQFQGWYTNAACTSDRVSTDNTIYYDIISSGLTSGTAVEKKYYAKYLESITAEFENEGSHDMEVGDTYESISYSRTSSATATDDDEDEENFFWYEIVDNTPAGITTGSDNADKIISYNPSTKVVTAHNAGTATLRLHQRAHGLYEAVDAEYEFTVSKKTNALKCAWNNGSAGDDWDENMNFDSKLPVKFSSTNTSGPAISVTQSPASAVATFKNGAGGANPDTIITNFREGTVTWTVSQAEDYKYIGDEVTCSVNVGTDPNCGCNIYTYAGTDNSTTVDNLDCNWTEVGVADSLFFQLKKRGAGRRCQLDVGYKDNGTTKYVGFKEYRAEDDDYYHEFKDDVHDNAIKLQFRQYYTSDPYIKDIRVTRKRWFNIKNAAGDAEITELSMPSRILSGDSTVATFKVDYSTCASTIKVASNNPHIVVKESDRSFSSTTHGERTITLKYSSTEVENITDAVVTIYTPYEHKTLTVNAETKGKLSTTIEYKGADSYAVDHANMSATDLFQVRDENGDLLASPAITLSSSATGVINTVSSNTAIDFLCGGAATITASYAGDATYAAASNLGRTITVNKLSDAISWSSVGDDGKIHVLADTDIPTSIASANSDIASYSVASANPYLSVTEEEGVYTLHAGIVGEVALTATSAGDCTYATASGSKTIAVDPREHAIIWDQNLEGIQTDDRGYITNRRITLNAYAVDNGSNPTSVPVSYEITGGGTFATIENGNELVINVANLSGTLSTTITATTTVGTKYAIVSETKTISVVRWGTNTAKSADNTSDIVDGKIVISAPHATFTFSGATAITEFGYATVMGKPEGYKLAQSLDKNGGSMTYNFSWVSTNANCSIQVNKISFWIKAYDSDAFVANKAKVSFDGAKVVSVGTAAMTANDGDFKPFSKAENYTNRNVPVVCWVTGSENFDFYIKNIAIEYTVYTTAPSATGDIEQVDRTINAESDKKTVDVRDLFSYATPAPSDFEYSYEIVGAPEHAFLEGGYMFWADAVGDYTVRAKVNMEEDHRESDWSDEKTIRVNRVPYVFNNSAADKNWETTTNWRIGGWPIENLPTADDDVIVRGQLSVSEEIPVRSLTIDGGLGGVVEIAPTGGLTVGVGGIKGATTANLKLKTSTSGPNKGKTGYLRISPDCADEMPEVTIELLRLGYTNGGVTAGTFSMSGTSTWQYVGCPVEKAGKLVKRVVAGWINSWDEETGTWVNTKGSLVVTPFDGFANTQDEDANGALNPFKGKLVDNTTYNIPLSYHAGSTMPGWNLLANSFAAPIDIKALFDDNDEADVEKTIYLFNTGNSSDVSGSAGTYTVITKANAGETVAEVAYQGIIPAMQGFFVKANSACDFTFNYRNAVWNATYEDGFVNTPMRVNRRSTNNEKQVVSVSLESNGMRDNVLLIETEDYSTDFENGYDAHMMPVGAFNIFAVENEDHLAIDATNSIIGTRLGVRTGEETAYTMTFDYVESENELALVDVEAEQTMDINKGTMYTFFAEPNSVITERFMIVERQEAPSITTGIENTEKNAKVHKFIKDNQMYILKNGVLYNAMGAIVR